MRHTHLCGLNASGKAPRFVETAGIEPASEYTIQETTTCVVCYSVSLSPVQQTRRWASQPVKFHPANPGRLQGYPLIAASFRAPERYDSRRTGYLSSQSVIIIVAD